MTDDEVTHDQNGDQAPDVGPGPAPTGPKIMIFENERIEDLQHQIADEHGYELVDHELVLFVRKKAD